MTPTDHPAQCRAVAAALRQAASQAYGAGEDHRGDYLTAKALEWEMRADEVEEKAL